MSGIGWDTNSIVRRWSEMLLNVREWSGVSPGCPEVVGSSFRMSGCCGEALRLSWSGQVSLPDVREWSRGYPECPGMVWSLSQKCGSGQEAFPDVREWSEGLPGCLGVVVKPSRMSGCGREALPDVRE